MASQAHTPTTVIEPRSRSRYEQEWGTDFWAFVQQALRPGVTVLDVGAGRRPTIAPEDRPAGTLYVGMDISAGELEASAPGSYDETVVADAAALVPDLAERFDLIVAWQVLEHFGDLFAAAEAFQRYTRPDGWFVACLSGRNALFAIANRMLPDALGTGLVARLMRRPTETVFPAHYDHCDASGLRQAFAEWDELTVTAHWRGADYLERFPRLRSIYLRYEDWAIRGDRENLATHYVIAARRGRD